MSQRGTSTKARVVVEGFGTIGLRSTDRQDSKRCTVTLGAQLTNDAGYQLIRHAVDQITGTKITDKRGHHSSMTIVIEVSVLGKRDGVRFARETCFDLLAQIKSDAIRAAETASHHPIQPARASSKRTHARS